MSALAPTIRVAGAVLGIILIDIALLSDRPALGFYGVAIAALVALATRSRARPTGSFPMRPLALLAFAVAALLAAVYAGTAFQRHLLVALPIILHLALLTVFGSSLLPGRTALVTCFSRVERAPVVDPVIERYTRAVNWIWTGYFAAVAFATMAMSASGRPAEATWITTVASPLAAIALFTGEHAYRWLRPAVFGPTSMLRTFRSMADPAAWRMVKHGG